MDEGLEPLPNRESVKMTPAVKDMILAKIRKVCTYFVDKYNETAKEVDCFTEAWNKFGEATYNIPGTNVNINLVDILEYSNTATINTVTVKGITRIDLKHLSKNLTYMFFNYRVSGRMNWGKFKSGYESDIYDLYNKDYHQKYIFAQNQPKGVLKDYIKEKYPNAMFLQEKSVGTRPLGRPYRIHQQPQHYISLLKLKDQPKNEWRQIIAEYQELEKRIIDKVLKIGDIVPDDAWLEERKANRKKSTRISVTKEEINPKWATQGPVDVLFGSTGSLPINEARRLAILNVYGTLEDKEKLKWAFKMGTGNKRIGSCWLSPRDIKKLEKDPVHNFISIEQFMVGTNKPFQVYTTSLRIENLINANPKVFRNTELIKKFNTELGDSMENLIKYQKDNKAEVYTGDLREAILTIAETENRWDPTMIDEVVQVEEALATALDFLSIIFSLDKAQLENPIMIAAIRDTLKYRNVKLNLDHYNVKTTFVNTEPVLVNSTVVVTEEPEFEPFTF